MVVSQYNSNPTSPQMNITRIGLAFLKWVKKKAAANIARLKAKRGRFSDGEPKLSFVIKSRAAAAIRPIIVGRRALNTSLTSRESLCERRYLLTHIIRIKESHMMAIDARTAPQTAAQ